MNRRLASRSVCRWLVAACLPALVGSTAVDAFAQGENEVAAEVLFDEAIALAQKGQYAAAAERFARSYALDPARGTLLGLAMAERKGGRLAEAYNHFGLLVREAREAGDADRLAIADDAMRALRPYVSFVTVRAPEGWEVRIDERPLPEWVVDRYAVSPGEHVVEARDEASGMRAREVVRVRIGQEKLVTLEPTAPDTPSVEGGEDISALEVGGMVTSSVGVVMLGVGAGLYVAAGGIFDEVRAACEPLGGNCPGQAVNVDRGQSLEQVGQVTLGIGAVLAAAGATMWITGAVLRGDDGADNADEAVNVALAPVVGPAYLGVIGRF